MKASQYKITQEPRYRDRLQILEDFWDMADAPRARWVMNLSSGNLPLLNPDLSHPAFFQDKGLQLEEQLKVVQWAQGLELNDLYVPHLQPHAGVTIFASAFGCRVDFPEGMYPQSRLAINARDPVDMVYHLKKPRTTDNQLGEMLAFTEYFAAQTGGRYPIQMTDIQSPIDTALLIWDPNALMLAMYDQPEAVHHLMRVVTDLTIDFVRAHRARAPEFIPVHYPAVWYPDGKGLAISDDALAVLSPQTYKEFALPYTNELSEEFNGVVIHSCGDFIHQFENLEQVHKLRGINFGATETPFEAVWERFNGKTAILPHTGLNKDIHFANQLDYVEHLLQRKTHNRGLLIIVTPEKILDSELDAPMLETVGAQINQWLDEDMQ